MFLISGKFMEKVIFPTAEGQWKPVFAAQSHSVPARPAHGGGVPRCPPRLGCAHGGPSASVGGLCRGTGDSRSLTGAPSQSSCLGGRSERAEGCPGGESPSPRRSRLLGCVNEPLGDTVDCERSNFLKNMEDYYFTPLS